MPSSETDGSTNKADDESWRSFEKLAAVFYEQNGFEVLKRNYRAGRLEIDLIVRKDNLVVFVEVKSARSRKFGHPVERVDARKTANLTRAARQFLIEEEVENYDLRFDVVTFLDGQLEHFPGAFNAVE